MNEPRRRLTSQQPQHSLPDNGFGHFAHHPSPRASTFAGLPTFPATTVLLGFRQQLTETIDLTSPPRGPPRIGRRNHVLDGRLAVQFVRRLRNWDDENF